MIIDVLQSITSHCNIHDQIRCTKIDGNTHNLIYIFSLGGNLDITYDVFEQNKFSKLKKLDCSEMNNIKNVNNLQFLSQTLEELTFDTWKNGIINEKNFCKLKKINKVDNFSLFASGMNIYQIMNGYACLRYSN